MAKRKLELDDLDSVDEPIPHASIHGVVKSLSPKMKKGRKGNYYEGKVYFNDKSSPSRFLGFVPKHLDALHKIKAEKQPVHFDDVEVAKARRGSKMEVVIKSSTTIGKSPKKYEENIFAEEVDTINQLDSKDTYEKVNVHIKALNILKIGKSTTGANVQEVLIADATGHCRCSLGRHSLGN